MLIDNEEKMRILEESAKSMIAIPEKTEIEKTLEKIPEDESNKRISLN